MKKTRPEKAKGLKITIKIPCTRIYRQVRGIDIFSILNSRWNCFLKDVFFSARLQERNEHSFRKKTKHRLKSLKPTYALQKCNLQIEVSESQD